MSEGPNGAWAGEKPDATPEEEVASEPTRDEEAGPEPAAGKREQDVEITLEKTGWETDDELDEIAEGQVPVVDELAEARRERDEYLSALQHLQADFENFKKRTRAHQADSLARAAEGLVDKLLPALDTADLAAAHTDSEELRQVRAAFLEALEREGLERIAPEGAAFDPTLHDAVAHEPGEGDQEVAEVLRAGYAWKGRVLRPAMVKVRG